ncbi:MAG: hydantoinase/oxoprolinase family protein [Clostridiales Family XIII bacterium]|jgi:N-methylhydantoinase A/oxoprolinase/acetone carboxylase beta subunit|nr:hydantoinase/oxoprolinase family protein [Clostridiales Family XIII bacterium]
MSIVLGIDTGGTYTDGVIIDRAEKRILAKAKALTTRDDLSRGITSCMNNLIFDSFDQIDMVSLSTTLATNAIVEGKGCEVGLVMVGFEPTGDLPCSEIRCIPGGHTVQGNEKKPFDDTLAREAIESLRGLVDAVAVSSYLSIRNPEHELRCRDLIREILNVPVICAHHLTRTLGIQERTVTAVLNSRLLPIIKELLTSVKKSLGEKNIHAPIMIVKGDGTLIGEAQAEMKPIETLLSGPAASIIGATFMSDENDAIIMDMGGTTTDIAVLKDGVPGIGETGARVGGWLTHVEAAAINTYGLGGDSYLQMDFARHFQVGPKRVFPFCVVATEYPHLKDELRANVIPYAYLLQHAQITDCFILLNENITSSLSDREREVVRILREEPHSFFTIADRAGIEYNLLNLNRLVDLGVLGRISVTPTDVLHARGDYTGWDTEAAALAVKMLATRFNLSVEEFIALAVDKIVDELCYTVMQSLARQEGSEIDFKNDPAAVYFLGKQLHPSAENDLIECRLKPGLTIIGIGAPAAAWLPPMAERLGARLVIPEYPEVANAIGSATGRVIESVKILIHPGEYSVGFTVFSLWEKKNFENLEEAVAYGKELAVSKAEEAAHANGAKHMEITLTHHDDYVPSGGGDKDIYVESSIEAIAAERPEWYRKEEEENFFVDTRNRGMKVGND